MKKAIIATWLFKTSLSNLNAGEGSTNLKEIKTYGNGLPYISGQSVRHAIRKAIQRENPDVFKCTVEYPCGDITNCWLCDIFGYMQPKGTKRWSPLKVTPALGQIKHKITTDLILRLVNDIECPYCHKKINPFSARKSKNDKSDDTQETVETIRTKEIKVGQKLYCPECKKEFEAPYDIRQALAYKQLIENTYRVSVSIDINALGVEEAPQIKGFGKDSKIVGISYLKKYTNETFDGERKKRVKAIINAIANISDFASISREMTNTTPDVLLISYQDNYNNRLSSALELDEVGKIDKERFKSILEDTLKVKDAKLYVGAIPNTFKNQTEMQSVIDELSNANSNKEKIHKANTPREAIQELIKELDGTQNEST